MNRREFLKSTAGGAAIATVPVSVAQSQEAETPEPEDHGPIVIAGNGKITFPSSGKWVVTTMWQEPIEVGEIGLAFDTTFRSFQQIMDVEAGSMYWSDGQIIAHKI